MKKKNQLRILCGCLATLVLLGCVLGCLCDIFERKDSRSRFQEFYEQEQDFDVLFLGTSHMDSAVSPMDLWEQNGIVGFNLGTSGCRIATAYWILRNALEHTAPKLVVLDCAYLMDQKANQNINYMHRVFDTMPLSKVKVEALLDLYGWEEEVLRFLFPFSLYHNRWDELTEEDIFFTPQYGKMGVDPECEVVPAEIPTPMADTAQPVDNISTEYLIKIIELCRQEQIELLFTFFPFLASQENKNDAAYIRVLAEQYNIRYLDPVQLLEPLNLATDFRDNDYNNSHVNFSGTHKMSYFLGEYIMEHYPIPDRRQDPDYRAWQDYYGQYQEYKLSLLRQALTLDHYLVGAADRNYTVLVQFAGGEIPEEEMLRNLLKNLGISPEGSGSLLSNDPAAENDTFAFDADGVPTLLHNGEICHTWSSSAADGDIFVAVLAREDHTLLDAAAFSLETREKLQ